MIGNKLEPFKFWCQKVLPNVYDDSLSYYEYLCKLNEYLNEVIEQINTLTDNMEDYEEDLSAQWEAYKTGLNDEWLTYKTGLSAEWNTYRTDLTNQWTTTKNYIDNYFNNLNVQTEINNKLDALVADGTLTSLITPYMTTNMPQVVTDWLTANVDPVGSAVIVDNTLTISGAAADSKAVGDKCAEIIDNMSSVKCNNLITEWTDNYVTSSNATSLIESAGNSVSNEIEVNGGMTIYFYVDRSVNNIDRIGSFYDADHEFSSQLLGSQLTNVTTNVYSFQIQQASSAKYFRMNSVTYYKNNVAITSQNDFTLIAYQLGIFEDGKYVDFADRFILSNDPNYNAFTTCVNEIKSYTDGYASDSSATSGLVANNVSSVSNFIPVVNGTIIHFIMSAKDTFDGRVLSFYNAYKEWLVNTQLSGLTKVSDFHYTFTVTSFIAKYFRVNIKTNVKELVAIYTTQSTTDCYDKGVFKSNEILYKGNTNIPILNTITGKEIMCFGDSIMAHDGDYDNALNVINIGIPSVVRKYTGAKVMNFAHAGDTTSQILTIIQNTTFTNTDLVIINGGINDKIMSVNVDTVKSNIDSMFTKIWTDNPKCNIIYMNIHYISTNDNSYDTYRNAITEICNENGVPVMQLRKECNINSKNASSLLKDGTHPNNDGYKILNGYIVPFVKNHYKT